MNPIKSLLGRHLLAFLVSTSFFIGIFLGLIVLDVFGGKNCESDFKFINPEPDCEIFERKTSKMESLQTELEVEIDGYLEKKKADRISVFARDLVSKKFVGVGENDMFVMASLLKLPLAIAYFKLAEVNPELISKKTNYTGTENLYDIQDIQPQEKLVVGNDYSIEELLYHALVYSDNTAAEILSKNFVSYDYFQKILYAIGLLIKKDERNEDLVTARSYANLFRILYNSSYLTREYSDKILSMLSKSNFVDGAAAKLPKDTIISHKFGERTIYDEKTNQPIARQLHDCGIVYAKNGKEPYIFCIMTQGKNFPDLELIIQNISETIYDTIAD